MAAPSLIWNGDDVKAKVLAAAEKGIDKTMAAAVRDTKGSHPGWKNITGLAEGSVRIVKFATRQGNRVSGQWGSLGVKYVIFLELKHGSFLRMSGDRNYPMLAGVIRKAFGG